jgi:PAS domain S-box-containing protein
VTHETPFVRIAETINDAVVTIDADSEIQFANDGLPELTGYDRDQLIGESFTTVMPERFREAHEAGVGTDLGGAGIRLRLPGMA